MSQEASQSSNQVPDNQSSETKTRIRPVTILNDDNFGVWVWNLKYNLKTLGVYNCVLNPELGTQDQKDEAMLEIISSISDKIKMRVSYCKNPHQLFTSIESLFTNKTSFQATSLHMRLSSFKFRSGQHIPEGISELQNIIAKLKNLGEVVSDHMVEGVVLAALPASFRTFITVWKGISQEDRTLANLFNRILAEVEDNRLFSGREDKALVVHRKNFGQSKQGSAKKDSYSKGSKKVCRYCKNSGHVIEECRKLKKKKEEEASATSCAGTSKRTNFAMMASRNRSATWVADSGASLHMTSRKDWLHSYQAFEIPKEIYMADDSHILALGSGSIVTTVGTMQEVLYMPDIGSNLFSIPSATRKGLQIEYQGDQVIIRKGKEIMLVGELKHGLYVLEFEIIAPPSGNVFVARSLDDWHKCLGHVSKQVIKAMADGKLVDGLEIKSEKDKSQCQDCALNKGHAAPHRVRSTSRADSSGISLHFDTVGPNQTPSLNGSKYFVLCKDEASAYRKVGFVECKSEIPHIVKKMINQACVETKNKVVRVCTDNGTEYVNNKLTSFFNEQGITHVLSAPYVPQQNGIIERDVRTVMESARTMINSAKLHKSLWAEAVNTAIHTLNRVPTTNNPTKTPYELWFGQKPNIKNLRPFGQEAVVNKPVIHRNGKWDTTGEVMRLVGYTNLLNTYRFYDSNKDKIVISCNVTFLDNGLNPEAVNSDPVSPENQNYNTTHYTKERKTSSPCHQTESPTENYDPRENAEIIDDQNESTDVASNFQYDSANSTIINESESTIINDDVPAIQDPIESDQIAHDSTSALVHEQEEIASKIPRELFIKGKPPVIIGSRLRERSSTFSKQTEKPHALVSKKDASDEPLTYKEATTGPNKEKWLEAMSDEMRSLDKNQVWTLVPRPKQTNIVTNRWIFKQKCKPNGEIERYRARLVARGFSQVHGIDYSETYAPVANMPTVRLLLAHAAIKSLKFKQFDIKTAFLYGNLDEKVYMEQPEGFNDGSHNVCLLKKSLYGLKQAPRQWNKEFSNFLLSLNLKESCYDRCVYYRIKPTYLIIVIYVDDGLIFAPDIKEIDKVLFELKNRFEVHEADSTVFLGFQISSGTGNVIKIHQSSFVGKLISKFNMTGAKAVDNPSTLTKMSIQSSKIGDHVPYREAVGSLMYAANTVRIDIAHAVNRVSRNVSQPTQQDWIDVKRILRYLSDKQNLCISYKKGEANFHAYCDADFAGDPKHYSTTGYVIMLGGGPIHWKCQKQALIALSSTEAELVSLCSLAKELVWLKNLATEIGIIKMGPTTIHCDNISAIRLAQDEGSVHRTRHMGVRAAFVRELIAKQELKVEHVSTEKQAADMLTKPLTTAKFNFNRAILMALTLFTLIAASVSCMTFESTGPIIWLPTSSYVDAGVVEYDLLWTLINPCSSLKRLPINLKTKRMVKRQQPPPGVFVPPMNQGLPSNNQGSIPNSGPNPNLAPMPNQIPAQNQGATPNHVVHPNQASPNMDLMQQQMDDFIINECNQMWSSVFIDSLNDLRSRAPLVKPGHRVHSRSIIDALETTAEMVCAGCITNLISTVISRFNPHSDHNRIASIEDRQIDMESKINEFQENFNITHEIQKGVLQTLMGLNAHQRQLENQMNHLAYLMPRISWISAYIQQRITTAAADLRTVVDEYSHSRVACKEMAIFLGLTELREVENADTKFESIQRLNKNQLRLKFILRKRSMDTFVYKVSAFRYWDNLTETPSLMEYRGYNYLIHNETSNCLKAIEEPSQAAILEECTEHNYTDPRLTMWEKLIETRDIYHFNHTCQVKRTLEYNYIYCFPFNITTKMGVFRNPPHVFRLPLREAFELPVMKYTPVIRKLNISGPFEFPAIDSTHISQFPMGSEAVDESKWFDKMQALMVKNEQLIASKEKSISIEKQGATFWFLIVLIIILVSSTAGLTLYNLKISEKSTQRHAKIACDIMEMKSNYCEVIRPDCEHCKSKPNKVNGHDNPSFNVGNDASVNITVLGRSLPSKPKMAEEGSIC